MTAASLSPLGFVLFIKLFGHQIHVVNSEVKDRDG